MSLWVIIWITATIKTQQLCPDVLTRISVHVATASIRGMTDRRFRFIENRTYGPIRLGNAWIDKSRVTCAINCLKNYTGCASFMFHSKTGLCTPGYYINFNEPPPKSTEGDLYVNTHCDFLGGFKVYTYKQLSACLAKFGPANYTVADADCQSRGAYLSPVRSLNRYNLFYHYYGNVSTWFGCDDLEVKGNFTWKRDGGPLLQIQRDTNFAANDSRSVDNKHCVNLLPYQAKLWVSDCSRFMYYFCEMPFDCTPPYEC